MITYHKAYNLNTIKGNQFIYFTDLFSNSLENIFVYLSLEICKLFEFYYYCEEIVKWITAFSYLCSLLVGGLLL